MAASAPLALKAGVWFRRGRLFIVSPDSLGTACPLSGRSSTYRPVQILEAGSHLLSQKSPRNRIVFLGKNLAANVAHLARHDNLTLRGRLRGRGHHMRMETTSA